MHPPSLAELKLLMLDPNLKEEQLVKSLILMSQNFTTKREQISAYTLDEQFVSAYVAFYFSTNVYKLYFLLSLLDEELKAAILRSHLIDVGAGPGTYTFAFLQMQQHLNLLTLNQNQHYTLIEKSALMQRQAEKILKYYFPQKKFLFNFSKDSTFENIDLGRCMLFGHSVNEIGVKESLQLISELGPQYIILIEPANRDLFHQLKSMREQLILSDYEIVFPCESQANCPSDWCHLTLRQTLPQDLERLSQLVKLDRKIMPFVGMIYKKKNILKEMNNHQNEEVNALRTHQFIAETKFSFTYRFCTQKLNSNQQLELIDIEILKKKMSKQAIKACKQLSLGEILHFSKLTPVSTQSSHTTPSILKFRGELIEQQGRDDED